MPEWHHLDSSSTMPKQQESTKKKTLKSSSRSFWFSTGLLCKRATLKKTKIGFRDQLSLNAGQKYCRMLQGEHSAILLTFIEIAFVIKIFILSIFELPFYTGLTVYVYGFIVMSADLDLLCFQKSKLKAGHLSIRLHMVIGFVQP